MVAPGDLVLVAISGGSDSTALLHALARLRPALGIRLRAAHVHHGIRGCAADADARAAEALARSLRVPFSLRWVNVPAHAEKRRLSLETAARELRYAALQEIAARCRAARIATGHTLDDQAETVLLNCLRGAGVRGLAGIPPIRGSIIRPLIDVTRGEARGYCKAEHLPYRLDQSNLDLSHTRNRVRREVIPMLARLQPAVASHLASLADVVRVEDEFISAEADAALRSLAGEGAADNGVRLPLAWLGALPPALQRRVARAAVARLKGDELDLGLERIDAIVQLALSGRTGAVVELPEGIRAERSYGNVVISRCAGASGRALREARLGSLGRTWPLSIPGEVVVPELGVSIRARQSHAKRPPGDPFAALLDADAVEPSLTVRSRRPGDRFRPIGMREATKLQDFLVNAKAPREERDRIPLVVSGEQILWVVGYRVGDSAKVTRTTRRTIRLEAVRL